MIKEFTGFGFCELDTAIMYCSGKTEKILGQLGMGKDSKVKIACKVNPIGRNFLTAKSLRGQFNLSLSRLGTKCVDILYLHMPDHETPIRDTLETVNELYEEGKFKRFGLSNYTSWQVMEIYKICEAEGWVLPSVYQGMYNAISRQIESELIPCLRSLKIAFYCYNPLAGGLLTGKYDYVKKGSPAIPKGRFRGVGGKWAMMYQDRFWHKSNFDGIELVKKAIQESGDKKLSMVEASFRWLVHHSKMDVKEGDCVVIGASKMDHLKQNCQAIKEAKALEKSVVLAFEEAWKLSIPNCPNYYR
uniref:NADP-dependent oxidoreductase domain-containing protein n=1 Tax=Amorphochlora amoebiformis TaxID=1561963 RepID=A0A7S0GPE9_9EUKA